MPMHLNLCKSYTYPQQLHHEETVKGSCSTSDQSPSHTSRSVSGSSIANYSIYTIRKGEAVVAVLMAAKLTYNKKFQHALGQVRSQFSSLGRAYIAPFSLAAPWVLHQIFDR